MGVMGELSMDESELYRLPFSIERHKSMPYSVALEVVIAPDGKIEYALPSHQEYLIAKAMEKKWVDSARTDGCVPAGILLQFSGMACERIGRISSGMGALDNECHDNAQTKEGSS